MLKRHQNIRQRAAARIVEVICKPLARKNRQQRFCKRMNICWGRMADGIANRNLVHTHRKKRFHYRNDLFRRNPPLKRAKESRGNIRPHPQAVLFRVRHQRTKYGHRLFDAHSDVLLRKGFACRGEKRDGLDSGPESAIEPFSIWD